METGRSSRNFVPEKARRMARYHVSIVRPEGYLHSECFREVAEGLVSAFRSLGHEAAMGDSTLDAKATNLVLGAHLLSEAEAFAVPPSTIFYNLEQLGGAVLPDWYLRLAAKYRIWDYSPLNLARWREVECVEPPVLLEIGFVPELRRIPVAPVQDIDVLFYGSHNERRLKVLRGLEAAGVRVHSVFGVYGAERDALIARARIVLNLHAYATEVFEVVRVSYLVTNAKAVVSEASPDVGELAQGVAVFGYEDLVAGCVGLLGDDAARRELELKGERIFARRSQAELLRPVLAGLSDPPVALGGQMQAKRPRKLNLGSGKDWREDCLNIDVNDYWKPDAVLDISAALPALLEVQTERFGGFAIEPGCFDEILANDVLEHIPNLTAAMTAALRLLSVGGVFRIQVPYDLAWGAWQDPTHVRAFNERSWLYYTEWFWYLGWTEARFTVQNLEFVLSPIGERLKNTCSGEDLVRSPRAVDSMRVTLRKQLLTAQESQFVANYLKRPERPAVPRASTAAALPPTADRTAVLVG